MEIDPRLNSGRETASSESTESASDYPEPPPQPAPQQPSSTAPTSYGTQSSQQYTLRATSPHLDSTDPNDPYSDLKRPRACEACRQLKVRCEPDLVNPDEPCKRCAKAGRSCIVTLPTRKRQKKTDSRVAELERKIDALTATLQTSQKVDALLPSNSNAQAPSSRDEHVGRRWLVSGQGGSNRSLPPPANQGSKRHASGEVKETGDTRSLSTQSHASNPSPIAEQTGDAGARAWRSSWSAPTPGDKETSKGPDIIDRGLVSPALALESFNRYVDSMSGHIPMVVFPPCIQMSEVRKNRPVLFHAIVAVAVGRFEPSVQHTLLLELYKTIAERVIVKGEKSLDLVQALLVSCAFYTPPENFEEIKFYQLAQLAVAVGMDIGMNRKSSNKIKPFNLLRDVVKHPPVTNPDSPEVRRAWLGCYFVSVQTSSALRRPILLRWLPYMDECVDILENSPDALPSDKVMIQWAKLARIIEEISARFFADDLGASLSFYESKSQFTLKAFEKQLEQWKKEVLHNYNTALMVQAEAIVNIYLHENAMSLDSPDEESKDPDADISSPNTAARISALSATLTSIHQSIDTICSIPVEELLNIPTVALARTAFAIVALIKLYSIVTVPNAYIGQVIEPRNLKVESYLDKVIAHYTAAGNLPGGVTPGKFSNVLSMLREWFKSRKDQHGVLHESFQTSRKGEPVMVPQPGSSQASNIPQPATPLHLLSEVATGDPKNRSSSSQQQHPQQPYATGFPQDSLPQQSPDLLSQTLPPCMALNPNPNACPPATAATPSTATQSDSAWAPYASQRQFYPSPFDSSASPNQQAATASGFPDLSSGSNGMMMSTPGVFAPELGIQVNYSDPNLFAFYELIGDGVLNFPLPPEGSGYF
ncbi:putative C6 transcription factor (War1) [Aspergillus lucknowensis]|uniref:Zn(2)-C6 fungal-type domain-containing protein n=1 Tax=Aspergillus lucknowensis TaxID=176173 RepID=A0ABR4LK82_9EURO